MEIKLYVSDAGRSTSKRPRQRNDCTVRALATALKMGYDETYELLARMGRKVSKGTNVHRDFLDKHPETTKIKDYIGKPLRLFLEDHPEGTYLITIPKHITALIDGVLYDDHFYGYYLHQPVQFAWQVKPDDTKGKPRKMRLKLQ